ncbi:hypothetical protein [Streptomyces sp. NRRL S-244]|uniref:hypothetical protein n=1 Tax=Streptomyces sp. NRRL S-244 TaxID=1463897 RepID=UPI0004C07C80|nr:hypothetical protein [Streptomyces sp. NRRL S-244]
MNTPPSAVRPPNAAPDAPPPAPPQPWLLVPALFTALTLAAGGLSYATSYLPRYPLWCSFPYLIPLGLAALTWRRPRTPAQRTNRIVAGSIGVGLALVCAKVIDVVFICVALAFWLIHGD